MITLKTKKITSMIMMGTMNMRILKMVTRIIPTIMMRLVMTMIAGDHDDHEDSDDQDHEHDEHVNDHSMHRENMMITSLRA